MIWWILGLGLLGFLSWIALQTLAIRELESRPDPVGGYEAAISQIRAMQEADNLDSARDVCITKLYDHGKQTDHIVVLLHGFTTCPEQFGELGRQYFDAGFNVFIPRLPFHGLPDRLTTELSQLTAEKLSAFGDQVIDIAHGLGKKVTVMGISGGGTLAAWLAQNRADIDYAFPIAAFLGTAGIPPSMTKHFTRFGLSLPNFYMWWDPTTKAANPYSIYYAYPRYPVRALMELLRLGLVTQMQAEKSAPAAKNIVMIINDAEPSVSNAEILQLLTLWQKHGKGSLSKYHFGKDMELPHDLITIGTRNFPAEEVYARLVGAIKDTHANH